MVHVGDNRRRIRSAELLVDGLTACMKKKPFIQVTISDLQAESGVSRATFYRLFDNVQDVLDYKCGSMALEISTQFLTLPSGQNESFLLFSLRYWMKEQPFLDAIFQSNRSDILQKALSENSEFLRNHFGLTGLSKNEFDYLLSASMSVLCSILITWVSHGKKESPEELVEIFSGFSSMIPSLFSGNFS